MLPKFKNLSLFTTALTHRSALNEPSISGTSSTISNERLEFLGDAVLELVITNFLFEKFPDQPEGTLTAYRSALVRTETLAQVATELGLGEKLFLSKGEEAGGGRENISLLADTFEAVVGALYLDQGIDVVISFIEKVLTPKFEVIKEKKLYKDSKSALQELLQAQGIEAPVYELIDEQGPDHAKVFTVSVKVKGEVAGLGTGNSKQVAQQQAATQALTKFEKSESLV